MQESLDTILYLYRGPVDSFDLEGFSFCPPDLSEAFIKDVKSGRFKWASVITKRDKSTKETSFHAEGEYHSKRDGKQIRAYLHGWHSLIATKGRDLKYGDSARVEIWYNYDIDSSFSIDYNLAVECFKTAEQEYLKNKGK